MSDILRLFIALPLPENIKAVLQTQRDALKTHLLNETSVRWTTPEQWHLTLAFLGATNRERLPTIQNIMERSAKQLQTFSLETTNLGTFPSLKRPSVVWLGVGGDIATLQTLQYKLTEGLTGLLEPHEKPFKPHLTLARIKQFGLGQEITGALASIPTTTASWSITELCLYQSVLKPSGAEYNLIHTVPLQTAANKNA
ncbi:MAG: RNA 2',3'-cyclic phosphodiesterase [Trueperaceae bacterium]